MILMFISDDAEVFQDWMMYLSPFLGERALYIKNMNVQFKNTYMMLWGLPRPHQTPFTFPVTNLIARQNH